MFKRLIGRFLLLALGVGICAPLSEAETLKITSSPTGATIEIDGVVVGTTPYEVNVPGGYFHGTHSVFGKLLGHPMHARLTLTGYSTKELDLTYGPMDWQNLSGTIHHQYYLLKTDHFHFDLEKTAGLLTGTIQTASQGITTVSMRAELPIEEVFRTSTPAVLYLERPYGGHGTGFFITETGVVATNAHVARGESSLAAISYSGGRYEARVVYVDPELDIALLKVDGTSFPHLNLSDISRVAPGQTVLAIGNPGAGLQNTVTKGIVSAVGSDPHLGKGTWIQTDAAINPGNSGGPLLDAWGGVIGINTEKPKDPKIQGIGFALSSTDLMSVLQRFYPTAEVSSATKTTTLDGGTGTANIISDFGDSEIYVDDKFIGSTPSTLKLSTGPHTVRVKATGRRTWERKVEILRDSQITLKAVLEPEK
jgi:serine protease Do